MFGWNVEVTNFSTDSQGNSLVIYAPIIISFFTMIITLAYTIVTYKLLDRTTKNHNELLGEQTKFQKDGKYFQYRRIWNGEVMIRARNMGRDIIEIANTSGAQDIYIWIKQGEHNSEWINLSLIAHFMDDIYIEHKSGVINDDQLRQGFPEFSYWCGELIAIYCKIPKEQRLTGHLIELSAMMRP